MRRTLYRVVVVVSLAFIALAMWQLHRTSAADYDAPGAGLDVPAQLNWVRSTLRGGAGEATQAWYPEGYFFAHALYGYTLVNQALLHPEGAQLRARNIAEIEWVLDRLESEAGRAPFPQAQAVEYGVFYQGWTNRLRGGLLLLQPDSERDPARVEQFKAAAGALADAYRASPTDHLEAYPGGCWPVDNVVALSSLALHDHLFGPTYEDVIEDWLAYTRAHLDPDTGLIPHRIDAATGSILQGSRGSSLVMMLTFLPEVDPDFAREQYRRFRERYIQPFLGFTLVREYPAGVDGLGDVDSGPLVFGYSPVSTVVGMMAARANGDYEVFERGVQLSEVLGVPITLGEEKRYYLGLVPIADEFQVLGKTIVPWRENAEPPAPVEYPRLTPAVHVWAYGIAVLWIAVLLAPIIRDRRKKGISKGNSSC